MANHNHLTLIGRITADLNLVYTPKGSAVLNFSLAINRAYTTEGGEKKESTTFVDVTAWGRVAEVVAEYSGKGETLFVEGRLEQETWDDKESGKSRSKLIVVAENVQLLGGKKSAEADKEPQTSKVSKKEGKAGRK